MLSIHTNIEDNDCIAMLALLVQRGGGKVVLPAEEIDSLLGEHTLIAEYLGNYGLSIKLAKVEASSE